MKKADIITLEDAAQIVVLSQVQVNGADALLSLNSGITSSSIHRQNRSLNTIHFINFR